MTVETELEYVQCIGCGKARPLEGAACPLCGENEHEPIDPQDVEERGWVL
jgi:rRNA maturation endonuclease Nob1